MWACFLSWDCITCQAASISLSRGRMSKPVRAANKTECCAIPHFVAERRKDWKPFPVLPFFAVLQGTWYLSYSSWPYGHFGVWLLESTEFCPLRRVKKQCGIKSSCVWHPVHCPPFLVLPIPAVPLTFPCVPSFRTDVICEYFHSLWYLPFLRRHNMLLPAASTRPCSILITYFLCDLVYLQLVQVMANSRLVERDHYSGVMQVSSMAGSGEGKYNVRKTKLFYLFLRPHIGFPRIRSSVLVVL